MAEGENWRHMATVPIVKEVLLQLEAAQEMRTLTSQEIALHRAPDLLPLKNRGLGSEQDYHTSAMEAQTQNSSISKPARGGKIIYIACLRMRGWPLLIVTRRRWWQTSSRVTWVQCHRDQGPSTGTHWVMSQETCPH